MTRFIDSTHGQLICEHSRGLKSRRFLRCRYHPLVERRIGTLRREYLDRTLFWTTVALETKLFDFPHFYNRRRTQAGLEGRLPEPGVDRSASPINFNSYRRRRHCRGLYQTPIGA
jgi:hypothetical protein